MKRYNYRKVLVWFLVFLLINIFVLSFLFADKKLSNIPIVFSASEMGVGLGIASVYTYDVKFQNLKNKVNNMSGTVFFTTKGHSAVFLKSENYLHSNYKYKLKFKSMNFPVNFYGVGNDTKFSDQEKVRLYWASLSPSVLRQLNEKSYLGFVFDVGSYDVRDFDQNKTLMSWSQFKGYKCLDYFGVGIVYDYDSRDKKFYPTKGCFINAEQLFYMQNFYHQSIECRVFRKISSRKDWILASRIIVENTQHDAPLWLMPEVNLRGIETTRFMDKSAINLEQELRFPLCKKWKGSFFIGAGNVGPDMLSLEIHQTKLSYGFGARYVLEEEQSVHFVLDFAFSNINDDDKSMYFYFKVLEKF